MSQGPSRATIPFDAVAPESTAGTASAGTVDIAARRNHAHNTPLTTLGDLLYMAASSVLSRLAGNTTTTRKFLRQAGNGSVSAAPVWDTLVAADLPASLYTAIWAYQSIAQAAIVTTTWTRIVFQTEVTDRLGEFDNATNYRFTAAVAGDYIVSAGVGLTTAHAGARIVVGLYVNGTLTARLADTTPGAIGTTAIYGSAPLFLAASDFVELYLWHNDSSSLVTVAGGDTTYFRVSRSH